MARGGFERPPAWAIIVGVPLIIAVVIGALTFDRGRVPEDVIAAAEKEAAASASASAEARRAAEEPLVLTRDGANPLTALFTGDSLTSGFYATGDSNSFRALMVSTLGPMEERRADRAGQTLTTVSSITEVPEGLDLAVVELGTNDVGAGTPLDEFSAAYRDLLNRIRITSPDAVILCAGVWRAETRGYDAEILNACTEAGGRFVPLSGIFTVLGTRGPEGAETYVGTRDDFHPNDAGHRAIADALLAEVVVR